MSYVLYLSIKLNNFYGFNGESRLELHETWLYNFFFLFTTINLYSLTILIELSSCDDFDQLNSSATSYLIDLNISGVYHDSKIRILFIRKHALRETSMRVGF